MRIHRSLLFALALGAGCGAPEPPADDLTREEATLIGHPFWLGVSWYGAIAAPHANVTADLAAFAGRGYNLVRVWATWDTPDLTASLVRSNGGVNPAALTRTKALIDQAAALGINVDLTFWPGVPGASDGGFASYQSSLTQAALDLEGRANVLFDLCNECDGGGTHPVLTDGQIGKLVGAVHGADPSRLVFVSDAAKAQSIEDPSLFPEKSAARYANDYFPEGVQLAAPHMVRTCDSSWATQTANRVNRFRAALPSRYRSKWIYLQEEHRRHFKACYEPTKSDFVTAAAGAKAAGAKGWTFHTQAGFDLHAATWVEQLDPVERQAFDALPGAVGL